jgi:hypothetical protein
VSLECVFPVIGCILLVCFVVIYKTSKCWINIFACGWFCFIATDDTSCLFDPGCKTTDDTCTLHFYVNRIIKQQTKFTNNMRQATCLKDEVLKFQ